MSRWIENILKELRVGFESIYGKRLVHMILFGSQARGDASPGSDIDVLIVLDGSVHPGLEIASTGAIRTEMSLKYNAVISCTFVSQERWASEQNPLFMNIHREGVAI